MNFEKYIWYLFRLNRDDFNRFDRKTEKVLREIFNQGKKFGEKETKKSIIKKIKIK